mmetsp:Transcript_150104/g.262150  ORF Transcript_150104/g.262150 Transcript_150104/m.262150 type:complete len:97 (-) Transcript_150104:483-773(-)
MASDQISLLYAYKCILLPWTFAFRIDLGVQSSSSHTATILVAAAATRQSLVAVKLTLVSLEATLVSLVTLPGLPQIPINQQYNALYPSLMLNPGLA